MSFINCCNNLLSKNKKAYKKKRLHRWFFSMCNTVTDWQWKEFNQIPFFKHPLWALFTTDMSDASK